MSLSARQSISNLELHNIRIALQRLLLKLSTSLKRGLKLWHIQQPYFRQKLRLFGKQIRLKSDAKGSRRGILSIVVVLLSKKGKILYKMLQLKPRSVKRSLAERAYNTAVAYVIILGIILVHARDVSKLLYLIRIAILWRWG